MPLLDGKVAMITGGSRGVGVATALKLAELNVATALVARDGRRLAEAGERVRRAGAPVLTISADVADEQAMGAAVVTIERELGGLDILVNNAGIGRYGPVDSFSVNEWRSVIETNLTGVFVATSAALPALRWRASGHIVAISSGAGRQGYPSMSAYCASKFGLHGFMAALAAELTGELIKCSTVVPGGIMTDFGVRTREERQASGDRFLLPDDVADAIIWVLQQPDRAWTQELNVWPR